MKSTRDARPDRSYDGAIKWMFAWGRIHRVGGTEQRMADAIPSLTSQNIEVSSLIRNTDAGTPFLDLMRSRTDDLTLVQSWTEFYRALRDYNGSLVWAFGFKQSLIARLVKSLHTVPWKLVMPRNGLDYSWKNWMHWLDRLTQKQVDTYITNSQSVSKHLIRRGIREERVRIVRSGLPRHWYEDSPDTANTSFVMVGNNRPEKNQIRGLEAFLESRVPTTLTIYTNDGTSLEVYLASRSRDEQERITVIEGHQLTPEDFDSFGALLHPSLSESLPLTILEAQARKCLVLASDTGDTADLIRDSNGLLIDPHSVQDITLKIVEAFELLSASRNRPTSFRRTVDDYVQDILQVLSPRSEKI